MFSSSRPGATGATDGRFDMTKTLVAVRGRARKLNERGAATAEYAMATVAACGLAGVLIALLKSSAMQSLLKAIINYALKAAGMEGIRI
jgi:hypothetical protein